MLRAIERERAIREDLERLEQAIADRMRDDPKHLRNRVNRDHEVAHFLGEIQQQSKNLVELCESGAIKREVDLMEASDPFDLFYSELEKLREHNSRYPNEQAENSELRYKPKPPRHAGLMLSPADTIFTGEESFGRFFDLVPIHQIFLNLPNVKHLTYVQYLEDFDNFTSGHGGLKRADKMTDDYLKYVTELAQYLESFRRRSKPLEDTDRTLSEIFDDFEKAWGTEGTEGWQVSNPPKTEAPPKAENPETIWCNDCDRYYANETVYKGHLSGKKHRRAVVNKVTVITDRQKRFAERQIAEREWRVKKLTELMNVERNGTRVNVERKLGMTQRERQQELDNLYNIDEELSGGEGAEDNAEIGEDGEEKIYNPLKLPLAWDGKPIPFWLYRLHGLGVEFHCEICGNFVYMGRRAFDKHFGEPRHIYGLKCLGITNVTLFRDITKIEDAVKLWERLQQEQSKSKVDEGSIVQMEDSEGNVMPEKVYYDLQKQGLL